MAREGLKSLVETRRDLQLLATFESTENVDDFLRNNYVNIIFLDIELPGRSGIAFARSLPRGISVIFTTAFSKYAVESYDIEAVDYLVKPIRTERFDQAVDRAVRSIESVRDRRESQDSPDDGFIIVKSERRFVRVPLDDISYIEALKDYMSIHSGGKTIVTRMTMKEMADSLPSRRFMRVSNSFIVNIRKIESFDNNDIYIDDIQIPIGVTYRERILKRLSPEL